MALDLPPYDGRERRFHHTDADRREGWRAVAAVLRLTGPAPDGALYDLSFYSGGIGVIDRLAITLPASSALWQEATSAFHTQTPEEAALDPSFAAELAWLFADSESPCPLRPAAVEFIERERRDFQGRCEGTSRLAIGRDSDVNSYHVLWGDDATLNYLGYDQG